MLNLPGGGPIRNIVDAHEGLNFPGTRPYACNEVLKFVEGRVSLNLSNVYICVASHTTIRTTLCMILSRDSVSNVLCW